MPASFVTGQTVTASTTSGTGTLTTGSFAGSTTTGNLIVVGVSFDSGTLNTVTAVSDSKSNTYTKILALDGAQDVTLWYAQNITGDGVADDTTAVQAAFDSGRPVLIDRTHLVGALVATSGLTVTGTPDSVLLRKAASTYTISINSGSGGSSDPTTNIHDVEFIGVGFDDNVAVNTFRQGDAQLNLNACTNVLIQGCRFVGFRSDAVYLGSSNTGATERHNLRVKIVDNWFNGVNKDNRQAISVVDCDDLLISGNSFYNCTRSNMPGAIDVEPNPSNTFAVTRNIFGSPRTSSATSGATPGPSPSSSRSPRPASPPRRRTSPSRTTRSSAATT